MVVVGRDLISAARIIDAAAQRGLAAARVDHPADLPVSEDTTIAFVDWSARDDSWGGALRSWSRNGAASRRVVLFGYHTDLAAHAEARRLGLGPMLARSRLFSSIRDLLDP